MLIIKDIKFQLFLTLLLVFFVLYPNPLKLGLSIYRIFHPPVHPEEAVHIFPIDVSQENLTPSELEALVIENIPYQYDWTTYGMPWYFPTVEEVIENQTGDCKSRMIVLASIFEYMDQPYDIRYSLDHFWVDYPGKVATGIEREEVALYSREEGFQIPDVQWESTLNAYSAFWDYMPTDVKLAFYIAMFLPAFLVRISFERWLQFKKFRLLIFHNSPFRCLKIFTELNCKEP